jgi:NAD(P)-dependent dehydrogenase (short-subunit alcohol dehydrogenase family)
MTKLTNAKIVVLGGGSGIGLAAAEAMAELGGEVIIAGRNAARIAAAVARTGGRVRGDTVDATSAGALRAFYGRVGPFHHLVLALSGAGGAGPLAELTTEALRQGCEAKLFAHVTAAREALATLAGDGSITFVSAGSARSWLPGTAGLAAINGAIEAMVRPLAAELRPRRVNAVSPGVIETSWWDAVPEPQRSATLARLAEQSLVGRNGRPEEAAAAIVYVVTNGFVTGSVLEVDGGLRFAAGGAALAART